jgi:CHRD domain
MSAERGQGITRFLAGLCMTLVLAACGGSGNVAGTSSKVFKSVMLNGAQVNPAVTTAATGSGFVSVDPDSGEVSGSINTFGISVTGGHIQSGAVGANGASILDLSQSSPGVWSVAAGAMLTSTQVDALRAGTLYVSLETAANPAGEIRGQIGRQVYYATLRGAQEGTPTGSTATGTGVYVFDPDTKTLSGSTTSTVNGTIAHIHTGAIGVSAAITFPFTGGPTTWALPATVLTDAQVGSLQTGGLYANVHSTAFPGGEIRGQLYIPVKSANLTGAQETPPNASTASGIGTLSVNPFTGAVAGRIETTGINGIAAHAHQAAGGVAGAIVIPMTQTSPGIWTSAPGATVSDALLIAFMAGNLYLNVHSNAFTGGEIRGQLVQGQ